MSWNRIKAIVFKGINSLKRDIFRLFDIFFWPGFQLFTWGLFSVFIGQTSNTGMNYVSILLGAIILWTFFERASKDFSLAMIDDLWNRNFINIFSTPLSITEYILGASIIATFKLLVSIAFMFLLAYAMYGLQISSFGFYLIPCAIGLTIFGWSLSLLVQSCILRFGHTAEVFIWAVATLFQPLSCVFYPLAILPDWAQKIAVLIPSTFLFENMRNTMAGNAVNINEILISFTLNIVYFMLSAWFFKRSFDYSKDSGLLIKYY